MKIEDNNEIQSIKDTQYVPFTDLFNISKNGLILFFLCVIPIALYWRTLHYGMVWDDSDHLINNEFLNPVNFKNLFHFWEKVYWKLYIPVTYTLWGLIKQFSLFVGLKPENMFFFHAANILLHTINGLLVFTLLRQLVKNRWYALIGTLFFILHPIQVETVAWVSEFRGLLSFCFGFAALYYYLKSCHFKYEVTQTKKSNRYYVYGWLFFVAALLSKPSIVVILFFAPVLEFHIYRSTLKNLILRALPYLLPVIVIVLITLSAQGNNDVNHPYPLWIRPFVFSDNLLFYLKKIFIPINYTVTYARTTDYLSAHSWFYLTILLVFVMLVLFWKYHKKLELILIGMMLFTFGFFTVSGLLAFDFQLWSNVADRYIYISMFGMAIIVSATLVKLNINKNAIFLLATICLFGLALRTSFQIPVWTNGYNLWNHALTLNPNNYNSWLNRGTWYNDNKMYYEAMSDYEKSIEINPKEPLAYYNMGISLVELKEYNKAIKNFSLAIDIKQDDIDYYIQRANAYQELKIYVLAIKDFYYAISLGAENYNLYSSLGKLNLNTEHYDLACQAFDKCIQLDPKHDKAYYNRGFAYMKLENYDLAIKDFEKAIELNPNYDLAIKALDIVRRLNSLN